MSASRERLVSRVTWRACSGVTAAWRRCFSGYGRSRPPSARTSISGSSGTTWGRSQSSGPSIWSRRSGGFGPSFASRHSSSLIRVMPLGGSVRLVMPRTYVRDVRRRTTRLRRRQSNPYNCAVTKRGTAYVGTSGFAYVDWVPLFYPRGTKSNALLPEYAQRLDAVELNNTFYQHPKPDRIAAWLAQTPDDFRFIVKAQRGGSMRAFGSAAAETVAWLSAPYRLFGERLGGVLFRVPEQVARDDERLTMMLDAWPRALPLVVEFQHVSWHV